MYRPRRLAGQELGRVERPEGEAVAVQGPVRELQALAHQAEDDGVLAGVVAGAQGVDARSRPEAVRRPGRAGRGGTDPSRSPGPTISARRSAVPLGASFLKWWCRSTISMSAASPRARAASPTRRISRLTARLRFGEISKGMRPAALSSARRCSGSNPVVPTTSGTPRSCADPRQRQRPGREREVDHGVDGPSSVAERGTPSGPRPASGPTSSPRLGWSGAVERRAQPEAPGRPGSTG